MRHRGYSTEHAEDLTQGFFAKLLEKHFLLSSFKNYMANEWDRSQTEKRGGGQWFVSLDFNDAERWAKIEPADKSTPETVFVWPADKRTKQGLTPMAGLTVSSYGRYLNLRAAAGTRAIILFC